MAQKSGFFNALLNNNVPDRQYNANDYSDNLAVVIGNGVLRSLNDDLKVTASGLTCSVAYGRGFINGHYYLNDTAYTFPAVTASSADRYDRIMLRLNTDVTARNVTLVYVQGTASSTPVKPAPTRSGTIYDLVLADVFIEANATSAVVTDTRSDATICGWVYSVVGDNSFFTSLDNSFNTWFAQVREDLAAITLFKRYNWATTLATAGSTVTFDIPQYDAETCFIEVYVNGILENLTTDYTLSGTTITFSGTLTAGTEVTVKAYKSIDGTGVMSVADEITQLQNQFATLNGIQKFTYRCTGTNDNIALSEIAQSLYSGTIVSPISATASAFLTALGGQAYITALPADAQIEIDVTGVCGVGAAYAGSGSASSRYRFFSLGPNASSTKKVIFDFAKCHKITKVCAAESSNVIFFGTDLYIRNVNAVASSAASNCNIQMIAGANDTGRIIAEKCRLSVETTGSALMSTHGDFIDCDTKTQSTGADCYSFLVSTAGFIRVARGRHLAYCLASGKYSAPVCCSISATAGVILATDVNFPVVANGSYRQSLGAVGYAGNLIIQGLVSTLSNTGETVVATNHIQRNKP